MSRENVELARRGYEAFAHRGHEAVRRDWEQTYELFDEFSIEVEETLDCGDDVVVFLRYRERGSESGAEVEASMTHVWTARDGKAIRLRQFPDRRKALEVVGLSEQDARADS